MRLNQNVECAETTVLGAELTAIRLSAVHYLALACHSVPALGNVFVHLSGDRKALAAVQMLCASGISIQQLVLLVFDPSFSESVALRLLSRATVLSIVRPLLSL